MSYEGILSLNDLSPGTPINGASQAELAEAIRQLKAVVLNVLLQSHKPSGALRDISADILSSSSIGTGQIVNESVTADKLAEASVTAVKLAIDAVVSAAIAANAVTGDKIADGALEVRHFPAECVPLEALAEALSGAQIQSSALDDTLRAIGADHLKDGAVTDRAVANVAVTKLTGGTVGQLLVNNGTGWTALSLSGGLSYNSTTGQFVIEQSVKQAVIGDVKARGANGGGSATSWTTRDLGEISDESGIVAFSGNTFKLLPGTYAFYARCPVNGAVGRHQARLVQTNTDASIVIPIWGTSEQCVAAQSGWSIVQGSLIVTDADTVFKLEHWTQNAVATSGFGLAASSDNSTPYASHAEIFTTGTISKLA